MIELKPYLKVITNAVPNSICAIYDFDPYLHVWCWIYYDKWGSPITTSITMPEGKIVDKFTEENIGDIHLADYLNKENKKYIKEWNRRNGQ